MKVCTVVVTYNRINTLKKNLECLLKQTKFIETILVVNNNSTDGTYEYLNEMSNKYPQILVKNLKENIGGAGGFGTGIEEALKLTDIEYIWGMDDDAYPAENALEVLLENADQDTCLWSNCNNDEDFAGKKVKEVEDWMFVGFFIPTKIAKKIGIPRKEFFIYFDDSEYAKRIIKNGYKIKKVKDSVVVHKDTANQNKIVKKVLFKEMEFFSLPDWKLYYYVRNNILMYKWSELFKYRLVIWYITKFYIRILVFNPKQQKVFFKGYLDGIRGKGGIVIKP